MSDFLGAAGSLQRERELFDLEQKGIQHAPQISEAEQAVVQEKMKKLHLLLGQRVVAKYKLELQFGKGRSSKHPFAGAMTFWLSGTKLHGGGDEKIYECPDPACRAWILPQQIDQVTRVVDGKSQMVSVSLCGECGKVWDSDRTIGERLLKLTVQNWGYAVLEVFRRMEFNADIYLKYHPTDVRYKTAMEMARNRGGEEIAKARKNRGLHIYPLKNIIVDTKNGADLYGRIKAFITA